MDKHFRSLAAPTLEYSAVSSGMRWGGVRDGERWPLRLLEMEVRRGPRRNDRPDMFDAQQNRNCHCIDIGLSLVGICESRERVEWNLTQ